MPTRHFLCYCGRMRLWVDDQQTPPDDTWVHAHSAGEAMTYLVNSPRNVSRISLALHIVIAADDAKDLFEFLARSSYPGPPVISVHLPLTAVEGDL